MDSPVLQSLRKGDTPLVEMALDCGHRFETGAAVKHTEAVVRQNEAVVKHTEAVVRRNEAVMRQTEAVGLIPFVQVLLQQ